MCSSVWTDVLPAAAKGALFIDCSTIDVESAAQAARAGREARRRFRSTRRSRAASAAPEAATLTFMCGGAGECVRARPSRCWRRWASGIVHCGGAGAGQAAKICNNMILGISMIAVGEAFVLAEKLGLSHQALFDVASTSSGQCWSLTTYCPVPGPVPASPANNDYKPGFASALMLKDLKLAQEAAQAAGAATPLGKHAQEIYKAFARGAWRSRLLRDHPARSRIGGKREFVILRCELLRASKDDKVSACGPSFETPRKRAAPPE